MIEVLGSCLIVVGLDYLLICAFQIYRGTDGHPVHRCGKSISAWKSLKRLGAPLMAELEVLLDAELNTAHVRFMQSPSSVREGREHWSG